MGKKGGSGRRGGGRGGGGGERTFRGGGGGGGGGGGRFSSGIIDPALLARHAAAASSATGGRPPSPSRTASSAASKKKKKTKKPAGDPGKKGKKRKRDEDADKSEPKRSELGRTVSECAGAKKKKKPRTTRAEDDRRPGPQLSGGNNADLDTPDTLSIHPFGYPRWRRTEQLCRVLLFPPPPLPRLDDDDDSSTTRGGGSTRIPPARLVFVSDPERARRLASTFKPALHPAPSLAIHGRVKREQLRSAVAQACAVQAPAPSDDERDASAAASARSGAALFVSDESIDRLLSALREARKGRREQRRRGGERAADDAGVVVVHHDAPRSRAVLDLRRWAAQTLSGDTVDKAGSAVRRLVEIRLDGTQDDSGGRARNNWADVLAPESLSASSLRERIPPSDRNIAQAIVNAATKMVDSGDSPDRKKAAHGKLLVHLAVLRARLEKEEDVTRSEGEASSKADFGGAGDTMRKMKILGMIADDTACGRASRKGNREAALTRWLDCADGRKFGGSWKGAIRTGASAEPATRELATLLNGWRSDAKKPAAMVPKKKGDGGTTSSFVCGDCSARGEGQAWLALRSWRPNPSNGSSLDMEGSSDDEGDTAAAAHDNRRDFGDRAMAKSCGHNETAMFFLRPFAPLEVLNSRVCSRTSPAPGNAGYEGCLEFLRRVCAAAGRGVTYWDTECFAYIDGRKSRGNLVGGKVGKRNELARVLKLQKRELLNLSVCQLAWLLDSLRQWTLFRETSGEKEGCHPRLLVLGINLALSLVVRQGENGSLCSESPRASSPMGEEPAALKTERCRDVSLMSLPPQVMSRIIGFVLPGDSSQWHSLGSISLK